MFNGGSHPRGRLVIPILFGAVLPFLLSGCLWRTAKIAFVSYRDGNPEIYLMNADGSGQTRLTQNSAFDYGPAW